MFHALTRALSARGPARGRRGTRFEVEVAPLECRWLLSNMPVITESVTPRTLWPPNGRTVDVRVSGNVSVTDSAAHVTEVRYDVQDSQGAIEPSGPVMLDANGHYSFVVALEARRSGQDFNGRTYTISITSSDNLGDTNTQSTTVIVPHDRGHRSRRGPGDLGGAGATGSHTSGPGGPLGRSGGGNLGGRPNPGPANRLSFGGPGQDQSNTVSVPGNGNTVTQNVTNNQTNTYNFNNSFNSVAPITTSPSAGSGGDNGDEGDSSDQGGNPSNDHGAGSSGASSHHDNQDGGEGEGIGNGHGNGNGHGHHDD
jgi:hypothetical protein